MDAAVAAALAAGIARPTSSGLGGGGFATLWLAKAKRAVFLDFRETAPADLDPEAFERRPLPNHERGALIGVPGEIEGLYLLSRRYGSMKWARLVEPAKRLARQGFVVDGYLGKMTRRAAPALRSDPGLRALLLPGGRSVRSGQILKRPDLARTLERIADHGPDALKTDPIAGWIIEAARALKSPMKLEDLARYGAVERPALHVRWEGYDIYTAPPPSAGGLLLGQTLGLFSRRELRAFGYGTPSYQHHLAEAMRGAFADRMRAVGDPDVTPVDMPGLLGSAHLAARKRSIRPWATRRIPEFLVPEHGTHHLVTADGLGNMVSLTTTVNSLFGVRAMAGPSGILLNDELDDFAANKDVVRLGGPDNPNRARPGARPVSSMTPTVVVRAGKPVLALGGSGGTAIAPNVTQVLLSVLAFDRTPAEAAAARRLALPLRGPTLALEDGVSRAHVADLTRRGETVEVIDRTTTAVQLVRWTPNGWVAAADPRKQGSSASR